MKEIIIAFAIVFIGWACGAPASPSGTYFDVNLTGLNCDIYSFNGYSGDFSDGGLALSMNLTQEGGKLFAYGHFNGNFDGVALDGRYTVKGSLSTYQERLRLNLSLTLKGTYSYYNYYDGTYRGSFSSSFNSDVSLNRLTGKMEGTLKGRVSASGLGSQSLYEVISMDAPAGYVGNTGLEILIDGDKKLAGTGTITLPDGEQVDLIASAGFNGKTLQYKIQLKGDRSDSFAKGSSLTVTVTDESVTAVSGTVLGQKVNYDAAVTQYDGTYSGSYSDQHEAGLWNITVNNGNITGRFTDGSGAYSVAGRVQSKGSFVFYTDSGTQGTGKINFKTQVISGRYRNPIYKLSGKFLGAKN